MKIFNAIIEKISREEAVLKTRQKVNFNNLEWGTPCGAQRLLPDLDSGITLGGLRN